MRRRKEENTEMARNRKTKQQTCFADREFDRMPVKEKRALVQEALDELYLEGVFVKMLNAFGEPKFRNGSQVYVAIERATATERAFWGMENKVN
jgi:hypothetical protein